MTLAEHLFKYGYVASAYEPEMDPERSEATYQKMIGAYGEDNVWDYRILSAAFDTNDAFFSGGDMFRVKRRSDGKIGRLRQTGTTVGIPRFYYDFVEM